MSAGRGVLLQALAWGEPVHVVDEAGHRGRVLGISCQQALVVWEDVRLGAGFRSFKDLRVVSLEVV